MFSARQLNSLYGRRKIVRFANICKTNALRSSMKAKYGTILVMNGRIISHGFNKRVGHGNKCRQPIHAEQACIRGVPKKILRRSTIYLVRLGGGNVLKFGQPCEMCSRIIQKYNIRCVNLYEILTDFQIENMITNHLDQQRKRINIL